MFNVNRPQKKKFSSMHKMIMFELMKDVKLRDKVWLWIFRKRCCDLYQIGFIDGYYKNKS